ncbi:MAG: THUMP-like domain-containing protein [Phycisphaeraceae bacterium]
MSREIELWQSVARDAVLLQRAAAIDPGDVAQVAALRRSALAERVRVALALVEARQKAAIKFGEFGERIVADPAGVEQASSRAVGRVKAERVVEALGHSATVADLCCGIGGDSLTLDEAGLNVVAVDRDGLRAWMTRQNTRGRARAIAADVACLSLGDLPVHIDPARRDESSGRRAWRIEDYRPGPEVIGRLIERSRASCVKLSPGIDLTALPWPGEVEFVSEHGRLVQALLWSGAFERSPRTATLVSGGSVHRLAGVPSDPPIVPAARYLYAFDASVERAALVGLLSAQVDMGAIHAKLGLLTSERKINSPWLVGFELIERMPWRIKRVRQWLAAHDGGLIEVKTRDKACDPDRVQRQLRCDGGTSYTVFVLRFDTRVQALVTRRL